jgi:iron complex outermembrane receptor protein
MKAQKIFRRKELAVTISLLLAASGTALAQDQVADDQDSNDELVVEEVIVTGIRKSLRSSMNLKKGSEMIVEAVSAEDIGKLPDLSITDSLARLPGLTAQRLNGRSQVISIRGLAPDFTTALLNGREQVTVGDNRGIEFDQYPSELLSSVVVYKTPDASLIGQGLAGTADMLTIRPLAHGRQDIVINARYEWTQIGSLNAGAPDTGHRLSFSYIDQFADDTFGIAIGIADMSNASQGERFNAWGYPSTGDGELVIGGAKPYVRSSELDRTGIMGTLEYEPNDRFRTTLDLYYSTFEETQWLRGIELPLLWSAAQLQPGYTIDDGLVTQGQYTDVKGVMRNDVNFRDATVWSVGWNAEFAMGDDWTGNVDLARSEVERKDTILETYSGTGPAGEGATDTLGFEMVGNTGAFFNSSLDYTDENLIMLTSPQGWGGDIVPGGQLGYNNQPTVDDELNTIRLSGQRFMNGTISSMEFGLNYTDREKSLVRDEFFLALASGENAGPLQNVTGVTDLSFLGIPGMISYDPLANVRDGVYTQTRNPNADVIIKSWLVEEEIITAYAQFGVDTQWGNVPVTGNFGLQYVSWDQSSDAFASSGSGDGTETLPISGGKSDHEFLPSLNLSFDLGNDMYLRTALARTLARPRMDQMRASQEWNFDASKADSTDINNSPWSASGGNPELDPWIADGFDLSFEKYFLDGAGYLSVAVFYKNLKSWTFEDTIVQDFTGYPTGGIEPAMYEGLANVFVNGEGGRISGVEFAWSATGEIFTDALRDWGLIFNASYTDSRVRANPDDDPIDLPGLSKTVANLTLYYENQNFSARINGRYRDDFLGEVSGFGDGRNLRLVKAETIVDAQVGWTFTGDNWTNGLTLYAQIFNLTDEPFTTFNEGDSRQVIDYQRYGVSYLVGATYHF